MRRAIVSLSLVAVVAGVAPAAAEVSCARVVCAQTEAFAHFECWVSPGPMGGKVGNCLARTAGIAIGFSPMMVPGSANWSLRASCSWVSGTAQTGCGEADSDPQICTWPGLGDNACGGSLDEAFGPFSIALAPGECIGERMRAADSDVVIQIRSSSIAYKGLLVLGPVDQASSDTITSIRLAEVADGPGTCAP